MCEKAEASFWTVEEVDLACDMKDWKNLECNEQHFVSNMLSFFAASDGIAKENLASNFSNDIQAPEARFFHSFQLAVENTHSEMWSLLVDTCIKDEVEKDQLFNAI